MKKFLICALLLVTTSVILAADTSYEPFEIQSTDTENENESEYGGSVADDTNAETANNDAAGTEDNVDADSSNTLPAASNFGELGCAFNCSGHGMCVKRESTSTSNSTDAGDGGGDESGVQCECLAYWAGSGCSLPTAYNTEEIQNDKNFTISLLIGVGLIGGVLLLERLVASCRKVYLKRQGRDGFARVPEPMNLSVMDPGTPDSSDGRYRSSSFEDIEI